MMKWLKLYTSFGEINFTNAYLAGREFFTAVRKLRRAIPSLPALTAEITRLENRKYRNRKYRDWKYRNWNAYERREANIHCDNAVGSVLAGSVLLLWSCGCSITSSWSNERAVDCGLFFRGLHLQTCHLLSLFCTWSIYLSSPTEAVLEETGLTSKTSKRNSCYC